MPVDHHFASARTVAPYTLDWVNPMDCKRFDRGSLQANRMAVIGIGQSFRQPRPSSDRRLASGYKVSQLTAVLADPEDIPGIGPVAAMALARIA